MFKQLKCIITGRVQGVLFRSYIEDAGRRLGLVGTVENLSDGSVVVIAEGDEKKLWEFLDRLRIGSSDAAVKKVATEWREIKSFSFPDFSITYR